MMLPDFRLFGYFSAYVFPGAAGWAPQGNAAQFIEWDYDWATNPITSAVSALYVPWAIPKSTLTFRGEILTLGKRTSNRRLRVQADNAPMPSLPLLFLSPGPQQQAVGVFTGALQGNVVSSFLNWNQGSGPAAAVPWMQGNYQPLGLPMQSYYADMVLTDEMIQASIVSWVDNPLAPWNSLPALRISSVSLVTMDPTE
jgi:hypothetical protein